MNPWLAGLLIFCLRIGDVSFGTMRVMFLVRANRILAALMAIGEATVYLLAIARVLKGDLTPPLIIGYATGYAAGTVVGITMENWLALGLMLVRVISAEHGPRLRESLLAQHFGVTAVRAEGRAGEVHILFINVRRRRAAKLLESIRTLDPDAFVTMDPVSRAIGGHMPIYPGAAAIKK
ncbi:MAG: DUF2179 domain-containing protein [Phycisphaerae bacterium]|nr:DUF2179 domain-containing protein [Phycisphaerae bacterium]